MMISSSWTQNEMLPFPFWVFFIKKKATNILYQDKFMHYNDVWFLYSRNQEKNKYIS